MLSSHVLRSLSQLNREPLPSHRQSATSGQAKKSLHLTSAAVLESTGSIDAPLTDTEGDGLSGCLGQTAWGPYWLVEKPIAAVWPKAELCLRRHLIRSRTALADGVEVPHEVSSLVHSFPRTGVFLDLETCGFAGSMIFLVGLIHFRDNQLWLTQLLARDYREEKSILQALWDIAATGTSLVTFNGKSFDWPVVHDRSTRYHLGQDPRYQLDDSDDLSEQTVSHQTEHAPHGDPVQLFSSLRRSRRQRNANPAAPLKPISRRPELVHCDLLHHARRRWKSRLPNCKLQTLEYALCGRRRRGDIPGRDIPAAYHDYVRHRDPCQIKSILHHNALDLITLLQISMYIVPDPEFCDAHQSHQSYSTSGIDVGFLSDCG